MMAKYSISSLFLLTILVVNVQRGVSLKCYECSSDDEKSDCWLHVEKLTQTECGVITTTESPSTTPASGTTPTGVTTPASATTPASVTTPATTPTTVPTTAATNATSGTNQTAVPTTAATNAASGTTQTATPATPVTNPTSGTNQTAVPTNPVTNATSGTTQTAAATNPTSGTNPIVPSEDSQFSEADIMTMLHIFKEWKQNKTLPHALRKKREAAEWECAKIITKNKDSTKKMLERKCVKKSDAVCKDKKKDDDNKCELCSDKELCNSASNINLQLIPAFLSVFLALFFSSQ